MILWYTIAHTLHLATKATPCMAGQVHLLVLNKFESFLSLNIIKRWLQLLVMLDSS